MALPVLYKSLMKCAQILLIFCTMVLGIASSASECARILPNMSAAKLGNQFTQPERLYFLVREAFQRSDMFSSKPAMVASEALFLTQNIREKNLESLVAEYVLIAKKYEGDTTFTALDARKADYSALEAKLVATIKEPAVANRLSEMSSRRTIDFALTRELKEMEPKRRLEQERQRLLQSMEIEKFPEPQSTTFNHGSYNVVGSGRIRKIDDPVLQKMIDEVYKLGGEIWNTRSIDGNGKIVEIDIPGAIFWVKYKPIILIDLRQPFALSALAHETVHLRDLAPILKKHKAKGNLSKEEIETLARRDQLAVSAQVSSEKRAVAREIKFEIEYANHPLNQSNLRNALRVIESEFIPRNTYHLKVGVRTALSRMYLRLTQSKEESVKLGLEGVQGIHEKSPEQWLSIASKHMNEIVQFANKSRSEAIKELKAELKNAEGQQRLNPNLIKALKEQIEYFEKTNLFDLVFSPFDQQSLIASNSFHYAKELFWHHHRQL